MKPHIVVYYLVLFAVAAAVAAMFLNLGKAWENRYLEVERARKLELESARQLRF